MIQAVKRIKYRLIRWLIQIDLYFTGHYTLCGECGRFSPPPKNPKYIDYCPYC